MTALPSAATVMLGADVVLNTLADAGVDTVFANPGTSEMHLVAAMDREPRLRSVLCLFEGVATGAADGFARVAGRPACVLLHLGPGYSNGAANLHNARRAFSPVVVLVGDHSVDHRRLDSPLTSDISQLAAPNSVWLRSSSSPAIVATDVAEAVVASLGPPAGPSTLILPADIAWSAASLLPDRKVTQAATLDAPPVDAAAKAIREARSPVILIGGRALGRDGLAAATRLARRGFRVITETFPARQARGWDVIAPDRMKYFGEMASDDLREHDLLVLVGTPSPVSFFAYPRSPSDLVPPGARVLTLVPPGHDGVLALSSLADTLKCPETLVAPRSPRPDEPSGRLTVEGIGVSIARHLPEGAIVSDDAVTASLPIFSRTASAAPHDWLNLTGGAIGQGMPVATGAALARPDAKVLALTGDGAGMYTLQTLWTLARHKLDVIVVVFANRSYRILEVEHARTGAGPLGPTAAAMFDIGNPPLDWVALARAQGVPAVACRNSADFDWVFGRAMEEPGPFLIEAILD